VFKNSKLEKLAQENLASRVVMALSTLTIDDFMNHVLSAMKAPRHFRKARFSIVFYSKSVKFSIHFAGHNKLEKVFQKL